LGILIQSAVVSGDISSEVAQVIKAILKFDVDRCRWIAA
jgi:hypothetical protein